MEFFFPEVNKVIDKPRLGLLGSKEDICLGLVLNSLLFLNRGIKLGKDIVQLETLRIGTYMRNECTTKTWKAKSNYYKVSLSQNVYNPRQFWNRLNLVLNRYKKSILNQIQINNEFISDPFF